MKLELTKEELKLIIKALPYVGDREVEEEIEPEDRIGERCDALCSKLRKALTHNTAGPDRKYRDELSRKSVPRGTFALDGRSELFDGLYRVVKGDWTVAYFESEAHAIEYVAAGNKGAI